MRALKREKPDLEVSEKYILSYRKRQGLNILYYNPLVTGESDLRCTIRTIRLTAGEESMT